MENLDVRLCLDRFEFEFKTRVGRVRRTFLENIFSATKWYNSESPGDSRLPVKPVFRTARKVHFFHDTIIDDFTTSSSEHDSPFDIKVTKKKKKAVFR